MRTTQASVRAFIRRLGVRPEAVDDIAQEAYIIAYTKRHEFTVGTDFCAWVCQIARRLVANERRTEARRRQIISEQLTDLMLGRIEPASAAVAIEQEQHDALSRCIKQLPKQSQELLHERYYEDLRPSVIASNLGISSNQVRQRLLRLRRALLTCLKQQGGFATH